MGCKGKGMKSKGKDKLKDFLLLGRQIPVPEKCDGKVQLLA
jgi:hypothetical protein